MTGNWDDDSAWFGEATFSVTEKLDLTVGARHSDKKGGDYTYQPLDAFRTPDPAVKPQGDLFAGTEVLRSDPTRTRRRSTRISSQRRTKPPPT